MMLAFLNNHTCSNIKRYNIVDQKYPQEVEFCFCFCFSLVMNTGQ